MKVLFFVGSFKLGGTEKVAKLIGEGLRSRGHDVRFVALRAANDLEVDNVHVLLKSKRNFLVDSVLAWYRLFGVLRRVRPDCVASFSIGLDLFLFFQFFGRTAFVVDTNPFYFKKRWYFKYLLRFFERFPHIRRIVVPSTGLGDALSSFLWSRTKIAVIGNPVDTKQIHDHMRDELDERHLRNGNFILSGGRLVESKGFDGLITAYSRSKMGDYSLVIIGKGPMEDALSGLIAKLNLQNRVFLLGYKQNPYRYYSKARAFVLNTKLESFGNVLIEALYCGTPVVCSDCDFGPRDIIRNGENGFLFDVGDETGLIRCMEDVTMNESTNSNLSARAMASVRRFELDAILSEWENTLRMGKQQKDR